MKRDEPSSRARRFGEATDEKKTRTPPPALSSSSTLSLSPHPPALAPLLEKAQPYLTKAADTAAPLLDSLRPHAESAWAAVEPHARGATSALDARVGHLAPWQVAAGAGGLVALLLGAAGGLARRVTLLGLIAAAAAQVFGVKLD